MYRYNMYIGHIGVYRIPIQWLNEMVKLICFSKNSSKPPCVIMKLRPTKMVEKRCLFFVWNSFLFIVLFPSTCITLSSKIIVTHKYMLLKKCLSCRVHAEKSKRNRNSVFLQSKKHYQNKICVFPINHTHTPPRSAVENNNIIDRFASFDLEFFGTRAIKYYTWP